MRNNKMMTDEEWKSLKQFDAQYKEDECEPAVKVAAYIAGATLAYFALQIVRVLF